MLEQKAGIVPGLVREGDVTSSSRGDVPAASWPGDEDAFGSTILLKEWSVLRRSSFVNRAALQVK